MFHRAQDQGKAAHRGHPLRISRIGRRDPTRILRSRGRFEIASTAKKQKELKTDA
jgi:hypothetical protein